MENIKSKFVRNLRVYGVKKTIIKSLKFPLALMSNRTKARKWKMILESDMSAEDRFGAIYKENMWGSDESVSGSGSTIAYTKNLRKQLPILVEKYKIKKMLDAPCGDFNWMQKVLPSMNIDYIGGDIVKELIDSHKIKYEDQSKKFVHINIIEDTLPSADLMICRDCLFHLSFGDIKNVLANYIRSDIPYLLTTTHKVNLPNTNIRTGDFRLINLFSAPFFFDNEPLERIDDWMEPEPEREMCLWSRDQIIESAKKMDLYLRNENIR